MKLTVQGQGDVTLTQADFLASGGEGQVYCKGATAYKVYTDPTRCIPVGKLTELARIKDPDVVKPEVLLLDPKKNTPVGYTMRFVTDTLPLCQTFTRAFREREGLDHPKMLHLVRELQARLTNVHTAGILIVDANEMNFLTDVAFSKVYAIDVDSYQTPHYPATAIMPSVRDWSVLNNDFTEGSDWFSFACVAFQMFTGIHPYKGKHPAYSGPNAMTERMVAGVSVFAPGVSFPKVVYPFDVMPPAYLAWFRAVLSDGRRLAPPTGLLQAAPSPTGQVKPDVLSGDGVLDIQELFAWTEPVLGFLEIPGSPVPLAWTAKGVYRGKQLVYAWGTSTQPPIRSVGLSPKQGSPVVAWIEAGRLRLWDTVGIRPVVLDIRADQVASHGGVLHVRSGDALIEVVLTDMGSTVVASPRVAAHVLPHASRLHEGCLVQDMLGSKFVTVLPRAGIAPQIRVPELDSYVVLSARFDGRVLMVLGVKGGHYDRLVFTLDDGFGVATLRTLVPDVGMQGSLNFVALDNGVVVHLTEEEHLEVWGLSFLKSRVVDSKVLGAAEPMRLVKYGGRVAFLRGNTLSSMRIK